jgi:hypothetical protein
MLAGGPEQRRENVRMSNAPEVLATTTTNFNFNLPDVGGSWDQWGDETNANWNLLDGILLPIYGGRMTGLLVLSGNPTDALGAVTKQYADAGFTLLGNYLPLAGGTMTGQLNAAGGTGANLGITVGGAGYGFWRSSTALILVAGGVQIMTLNATGSSQFVAPLTMTAPLTIGSGQTLTLAADPAQPLQAATKQYVDARTPVAADAPSDGNAYGRINAAWSQVLPIGGGSLSGGLHFGNAVAPGGVTDLSRHIDLNSGTFGFSITSARLNIVIPAGSSAYFNAGGTDVVQVQPAGLFMLGGLRIDHGATLGSGVGDVSHHIVLYGGTGANNYGIGVSTGSLNLVSGNNVRIVDSSNANPLLQVNRNTATLFVPLALPADPTTALQAATKQYVDAHVAAMQATIDTLTAQLAQLQGSSSS